MKKIIFAMFLLITGCNDDNFNNAYYNLTKYSRAEDIIEQSHDPKHDITIKVMEFEKDELIKKYTARLTDPKNNTATLIPDSMGILKKRYNILRPGMYNIQICYSTGLKEYTGSSN